MARYSRGTWDRTANLDIRYHPRAVVSYSPYLRSL
jgi:hypothetical protein